jgi:transmembrane sensor
MTYDTHNAASQRDEQAASWCMRLADAQLSADEQAELDAWIAADPANAAAFEEAVAIWQRIDATTGMPEMIRFRAEAVEGLREANARRWARSPSRRWTVSAAMAACLAMLIVAAVLLLGDRAQTYQTDTGERRVVMLDDGTRLTLDASTRVDVRMERDRRRLELIAGRAKFDVAHDPLRPLSVLARNRLTVATGTSFSVELLPRQVRVILYQGKVEVLEQAQDGANRNLLAARTDDVALTPGHELIASTAGPEIRIDDTDVERSLTWETGLLSFDGEPLALAVERINRGARNKLVVGDAQIASYGISGVFAAGDVDAFVEGVSAIYPVQAVPGKAALVLKKRRPEENLAPPGV